MALCKEPSSVPLLRPVHTRKERGVGLVGYKQVHSANHSVLPSINQIKTLFLTDYSYNTRALSETTDLSIANDMKQRTVHGNACQKRH